MYKKHLSIGLDNPLTNQSNLANGEKNSILRITSRWSQLPCIYAFTVFNACTLETYHHHKAQLLLLLLF